MKLPEIAAAVNVHPACIENLMMNLEVDGIVIADGKKYQRTPRRFTFDSERIDALLPKPTDHAW